jgi:hypothetical protein
MDRTIDDADARGIERPQEVPGDDDEGAAAQRLELHELAVGRRGGGASRADQRAEFAA